MLFSVPRNCLLYARQIDINNCEIMVIRFTILASHTHTTINVIGGEGLMFCAMFLQCFAVFYMLFSVDE